ncbi:DNA mismatch repair protein MutS [Thermoanaerobacterium thermosaccharolyticum]|uniref:DNA mismatch repair protein MutS n=1 Tax=Thermoanaerobacterium thermosaccharolyticum (strain ATCC 7956 / DSM 571 / NCIMB 9385 / NCA 3814 / NCTC 13789 / WDCM 00135 / 2032) TaxID=580327 RepID=D9TTB6_THETC|nr:DNA mismatch repair protein MutS [Thermoanaerobacterium thermosaccharolyticum]ADL68882.1 DNA mismatch repair protein MutS [Thermoanaerobacterium thermosaccharolyticum DSM 571]KAA5807692.1 DNA mismatch repair protein MutS [Thermoanaerobacterium thermosaccharolyticum]TCW38605.1 DNA mismatch repair protein MutS [Thermohydrogenium kirishiense]
MPYTPMMEQYFKIKEKYKDSILFFRIGDFYEMFFDDAIIAAKELEIVLTGKDCGQDERAPMAGVPFHAADFYIDKLVKKGYKVAICEQLEDPASAKGLVDRDVIRVFTPGTVINTNSIEEKSNNYLLSIFKDENNYGLSFVDVMTGDLFVTQIIKCDDIRKIYDEIMRYNPSEIIANNDFFSLKKLVRVINSSKIYINKYENNYQDFESIISNQFNKSLNELGLEGKNYAIKSLTTVLIYLKELQKVQLSQLNNLTYYEDNSFMLLDNNTIKNLEIVQSPNRNNSRDGTLLSVLDQTVTPMGGRLLKRWIEEPLIDIEKINLRLDSVDELFNDFKGRSDLRNALKGIYDLERLSSKLVYQNINAKDLLSIKVSIERLPKIKDLISKYNSIYLKEIFLKLDTLQDIYDLIDKSIKDEPSTSVKEGNIIKDGFDKNVDELRKAATNGKSWITNLELNEKERTGIKTLKVGYNKVFGYFIEVSKSYISSVPQNYIRKQTLANAERYITPELKEIEEKILGAETKLVELEYEIFNGIREQIKNEINRIQMTSKYIAVLDVLTSLAMVAESNNYVKPIVNDGDRILIKDGRHPVIETIVDDSFISNDIEIDEKKPIMIITGPNMAGKSTYMRQVALIVLMAQVGSFVPASYAEIGIVDRIFTRVGASDDLFSGQSTFMVEMNEVSVILNSATQKSLIILDEVGRGTSTYDGMSIACAILEYIHDKIKAKTMFATHYHELTKLENQLNGIKNYNISVDETNDEIIFLRKIIPGSADKSYGIQVAKLAGLPNDVIDNAKKILNSLENSNGEVAVETAATQMDIFSFEKDALIAEIADLDIENITPIQALNYLYGLKKKALSLRM